MTDYKTYAQETIHRHFAEFFRRASAILAGKDIEDVHQLRVSFRRLNNAAKVFKDVIPPKAIKKWKEKSAELLKKSSQARDIDVQIVFLNGYKKRIRNPEQHAALGKLIGHLEKKRRQIQPGLIRAIQSLDFSKVGVGKEFSASGEKRKGVSLSRTGILAQMGQKKILKRLRKLLAFAPVVSQPDAHDAHHQMRIAAKHLRYTVEDFTVFYGPEAGRFAARVKELQDVLGDMHDSCVRIDLLPKVLGRHSLDQPMKDLLQVIVESCQRSHDQAYRRLVSVWQQAQDDGFWGKLKDLVSLPSGKGKK
jgi:CHAD domain-containing protein